MEPQDVAAPSRRFPAPRFASRGADLDGRGRRSRRVGRGGRAPRESARSCAGCRRAHPVPDREPIADSVPLADARAQSLAERLARPDRPGSRSRIYGRLTVLLLGSDARTSHSGNRTDVIMIVSLDPTTGAVAAASVPRDTANFPTSSKGIYRAKINGLYQSLMGKIGQPKAAAEMKRIIGAGIGVEIDSYAVIGFEGVRPHQCCRRRGRRSSQVRQRPLLPGSPRRVAVSSSQPAPTTSAAIGRSSSPGLARAITTSSVPAANPVRRGRRGGRSRSGSEKPGQAAADRRPLRQDGSAPRGRPGPVRHGVECKPGWRRKGGLRAAESGQRAAREHHSP